jgi:hypothetical protein
LRAKDVTTVSEGSLGGASSRWRAVLAGYWDGDRGRLEHDHRRGRDFRDRERGRDQDHDQ